MRQFLTSLAERRAGTTIVFLAVIAYFASTPHFFETENLFTLTRQYAEIGIIAAGMTLVVATGGIDISVGGTASMTSMLIGLLAVRHGIPIWPACAMAIACAGMVGVINGYCIAYLRLQPVLVTLATMSLTRGLAQLVTKTQAISLERFSSLQALSMNDLAIPGLPIPIPALILGSVFAGTAVLLRKTVYGRHWLAAGQSEAAAQLSGLPVKRAKLLAYLILSLLAGLAGILVSARTATSFPDAGANYEFEAITAVVLGGTSLSGGEGSLIGTLVGVATMAALRNGLSLGGQTDIVRTQMLALALIAAVIIDNIRTRLIRGGQSA